VLKRYRPAIRIVAGWAGWPGRTRSRGIGIEQRVGRHLLPPVEADLRHERLISLTQARRALCFFSGTIMSAPTTAVREITLQLPEALYERIRRAAEQSHRPFMDLLLEGLAAIAAALGAPPGIERASLAHMAFLNDAVLWQAARATMTPEQRERLEALHHKQQRESLTEGERREEQMLLRLYQDTLLIRAQAAVLLRQRGYDVADPLQFAPLG
jgi:hypothetical protein